MFFDLTFARMSTEGRWPRARLLQKDLARRPHSLDAPPDALDVIDAAAQLPAAYGFLDEEDRIVLTVRALRGVGAARDLLASYLEVVRMAHRRYGESGERDPRLALSDVVDQLGISNEIADRIGQLLDAEVNVFTRCETDDDSGEWCIRDMIRHYQDIRTIGDYLAVQRQHGSAAGTGGRRRRPGPLGWLRRPPKTIWDWIVLGVIVALIAAGVGAYLRYGGGSSATPPPHRSHPSATPGSRAPVDRASGRGGSPPAHPALGGPRSRAGSTSSGSAGS